MKVGGAECPIALSLPCPVACTFFSEEDWDEWSSYPCVLQRLCGIEGWAQSGVITSCVLSVFVSSFVLVFFYVLHSCLPSISFCSFQTSSRAVSIKDYKPETEVAPSLCGFFFRRTKWNRFLPIQIKRDAIVRNYRRSLHICLVFLYVPCQLSYEEWEREGVQTVFSGVLGPSRRPPIRSPNQTSRRPSRSHK